MSTIAFIGLGAMGGPMALNLMAAGHKLRVWNRSAAKTAAARDAGATVCASVAQAVQGAEFVVSMVADDRATREVMLGAEGVVANAAPGTLIVDCSTNTPAMAREVAAAGAARGVGYVDAPVSGSLAQARGRELVFMVGGSPADVARAEMLFQAMGRSYRHMGEVGTGATIKLINNMLSGTVNAAIAEALMVAEAAGLDAEATQYVLGEGAAGSRLFKTKMPKIFGRDFSPQFQLALMEKDLRYFLSLAQELDSPVPIAALVRSQMQGARRADLGALDVSAIFLHVSGEGAPAR
ncbi:MAG TPA: NAD(P)-dependent oxidoreductase [Burkholderiaceae bacterium]|jgi:3-hydroxyisobutyrate dehydrogenase-like beta-hydroxyacid dehydrogenase|nr:NAD(P)-dependent oxidoreductase [Burkholderiaceae bacterium]